MTIPDWEKLSDKEQSELPCVVCGNPFGFPAGGSYCICQYCWWEDCGSSFRVSWNGGGPNRFSLWQSRRHYELAGISDGPFFRPDLTQKIPPEMERYDWDLDPEFYSDCAMNWHGFDPVPDTLNALRCYGLFSARQIRQKMVKRREIFKPGETYRFPHTHVAISKIPRSTIVRRMEAVDGVQSVIVELDTRDQAKLGRHEFAKRLSQLTPDMLADSEFDFQADVNDPKIFTCMESKDTEGTGNTLRWSGDPNEYWIKVEFEDEMFSRLTFHAGENGSKPFIELDHDKEMMRNDSNS